MFKEHYSEFPLRIFPFLKNNNQANAFKSSKLYALKKIVNTKKTILQNISGNSVEQARKALYDITKNTIWNINIDLIPIKGNDVSLDNSQENEATMPDNSSIVTELPDKRENYNPCSLCIIKDSSIDTEGSDLEIREKKINLSNLEDSGIFHGLR